MRVLMTGVSGFVGTRLIQYLNERSIRVTGISRRHPSNLDTSYIHEIFDITPRANWQHLLDDKEVVVHLADGFNRFEHLSATARDEQAVERLEATLNLARQAIGNGVQKFIYLSTIKAMCGTWASGVLDENTAPQSTSLYGRLKLETEQKIMEAAEGTQTRVISLRFPVVFGEQSDGNFNSLLRLADTPIPLPFKNLESRRSLISRSSLADAITTVVLDQGAHDGTFLVHDEAISIAQLITHLRIALDRSPRLFQMPPGLWPTLEALPKIGDMTLRFTRPLELTDVRFRRNFSWAPPVTMTEKLYATARAYRRSSELVSRKVS